MRYLTLSSLPTVAYISAPTMRASCIAARPTPPQALWIRTDYMKTTVSGNHVLFSILREYI
ncbi:hypothetical protein I7I48_00615 [Histoplasma ohiense]|nr:hypothetical protein I7I48_00615 [Histoplasma ohiense (nom. inval.)]